MTLDQLLILVNIVEQGSMGAAAKALYRTQPTLSVSMKKLEEEFNVEIFSRTQRRMTLTPAGQAMYQKAKRVLERTDEFESFCQQLAVGNEPEVNIAFDASIPIRLISGVLKQCEAEFPQTSFNLLAENLFGTMERLTEREADLAIIPHFDGNPRFKAQPFFKYRFFPVAAANYPPAQSEHEVSLETMKDYVQVILTDSAKKTSSDTYGVLDGGRHWRVNNVQTKKEIIVEGLGWGRLPEFTIQTELDAGQVVPLKIENFERFRETEICVVCRADQLFGPVVQRLWESFQQLAAGRDENQPQTSSDKAIPPIIL